MRKILVIDDDSYICNLLVNYLQQKNYSVDGAYSGKKARELITKTDYNLILCDYRLPDSDGLEILEFIKLKKPNTPVIIMTAYAEIKTAVKLIKAGAFDYVTKPIQPEEILQLISRALDSNKDFFTETSFQHEFITGTNKEIQQIMQHVKAVAPTDLPVLVEGETGSGKEYIARAIHIASNRNKKPFIAVDCGAIPKELANSELFGHIKGAFTGAINDKKGFFEQANGGTLFLDEVGNLPHENQVKLLRALQEKIINKVGDNKALSVDVRILVASNEDLLKAVKAGEFREDLYHRINGFKIHLPSLRERKEDIMEFVGFFIGKANLAFNKNIKGIDENVKRLFLQYHWFGNIRELQNVVNRCVLLAQGEFISAEVVPDEIKMQAIKPDMQPDHRTDTSISDLKEATLLTEKEMITKALIKVNFNKSKAAQLLNIDRKTLYNKIRLYEIKVIK